MALFVFILVSLMSASRSDPLPGSLPSAARAYVPVQGLPANYGSAQSASRSVLTVPFSVVAISNDQADDIKTPIERVRDVVSNVAEKVADVVGEVRDRVANVREKVADVMNNRREFVSDLIGNVRDRVSDIVDKAKTRGNSREIISSVKKTTANSNETADSSVDVDSGDSDELKGDSSKDTDKSIDKNDSSKDTDKSIDKNDSSKDTDKSIDKNDDSGSASKERKSVNNISGGGSAEVKKDKQSSNDRDKDGSNENVDKNDSSQNKNDTQDSNENTEGNNKSDNNGGNSEEKEDSKSVWSWLKHLTGDRENDSGDGDEKIKRYLTQMSKVRGYLDAIDSSIAASQARQSGTCPIYPVQVGNNRVTITTQNGCKIIIKLKGLTVDSIDDGHTDKKTRGTARSVVVSYAGKN